MVQAKVVALGMIALLIFALAVLIRPTASLPSGSCAVNQFVNGNQGIFSCNPLYGLSGYWPLNEGTGTSAFDLSGNSNTGTLAGGTGTPAWISAPNCKSGQCLNFTTGNKQIVTTPLNYVANSLTTIVAWVNPRATSAVDIIAGASWEIAVDASAKLHFFSCGHGSVTGTTTIPTQSLTFIAVTINDANPNAIVLYVNGAQDASGNLASQIVDSAKFFLSGNNTTTAAPSGCGDHYWNGAIDDVRYYGRVLSASEISALYYEAVPMPVPPQTRLESRVLTDQTLAASTTFTSTTLAVTLAANAVYRFNAYFSVTTSAGGDLGMAIHALPAGATLVMACGFEQSSSTVLSNGCTGATGSELLNQGSNPTGAQMVVVIYGVVSMGSTSGTLQIDYREQVAVGSVTTKAGSFMTVEQIP